MKKLLHDHPSLGVAVQHLVSVINDEISKSKKESGNFASVNRFAIILTWLSSLNLSHCISLQPLQAYKLPRVKDIGTEDDTRQGVGFKAKN